MDNNLIQNSANVDRIITAKNRVLGIGRNNSISLHTLPSSVYRVTGINQIADIINCGYVRPKSGRVKGGHENEVFWSIGGEKTFYYDKRPVLETSVDKVKDGQIGSLSLDDLSAIWIFDYEQNSYLNKKDFISQVKDASQKAGIFVSGAQINQMLKQQIDRSEEISVEEFMQIREADRQRMTELRGQQLMNLNQSALTDENIIGKVR